MWLLPQKHVLTPKIHFLCQKESPLHVVMMKKVADRGFLAFWPLESQRKSRRKHKNAAKNLKFGKKWILPSKTPWNVQTYHHRHHYTSYYADHLFSIINTHCFIIHRCEFYLFLNRTVLFIYFMTNLSPMRKLSLFQT